MVVPKHNWDLPAAMASTDHSLDSHGDGAAPDMAALITHAEDATTLLKALGHEGRLMILCYLAHRPHSVTQLEELLDSRQAAVSQQLARLRLEGLVSARRDGHQIFYSLNDPRIGQILQFLQGFYTNAAP
jgi:DNA-binding transcriptional ArsR family regulator